VRLIGCRSGNVPGVRCSRPHPGELIGSGTVGNGSGLESLRFLADGDELELEVAGIGTIRNRVQR
jgi:2-keto-4-pentenoate hydratase/2-oxohepta-3-ene-1,7-dioic acid hydratase in catechol pathway